jgi:PAS domain-containing protein
VSGRDFRLHILFETKMNDLISCADMHRLDSSVTISKSEAAVDLEQLIAITNVPIFCIDINGIIVTSNAEFAAIVGCNRDELLGKNITRVTQSVVVC